MTGSLQVKQAVAYLRVSSNAQLNTDFERDGYSLPAQRSACEKKAEAIGAQVVAEFVERGVSAKTTARRSALAQMLERIKRGDIDFVIVHKLDRLARNRADDVAIVMAIRQAGATLVSVTENIDETPSGSLVHGIMSSIAEFYSNNLAAEVTKGLNEKAKRGGTPYRAPIGYLNRRQWVEDEFGGPTREVRTITLDPKRAQHVRAAFTLYATGNYSLGDLAAILEAKGLRTRAIARAPEQPVGVNRLQQLLRNDYYVGIVRYRGHAYAGRHEPLATEAVFDRVQAVLDTQRAGGERSWRNAQYLTGSLECGECGRKLVYTKVRGNGGVYEYFVCVGSKQGDCSQPHHPLRELEIEIEAQYRKVTLTPADRDTLRAFVLHRLGRLAGRESIERAKAEEQLAALKAQEKKLLGAHYADQISQDLFEEENLRLRRERIAAERTLGQLAVTLDSAMSGLDAALALTDRMDAAYCRTTNDSRRLFNQGIFKPFKVNNGRIDSEPQEPFLSLTAMLPRNDKTAAPSHWDGGLNFLHLVGDEGLEPPTPCV